MVSYSVEVLPAHGFYVTLVGNSVFEEPKRWFLAIEDPVTQSPSKNKKKLWVDCPNWIRTNISILLNVSWVIRPSYLQVSTRDSQRLKSVWPFFDLLYSSTLEMDDFGVVALSVNTFPVIFSLNKVYCFLYFVQLDGVASEGLSFSATSRLVVLLRSLFSHAFTSLPNLFQFPSQLRPFGVAALHLCFSLDGALWVDLPAAGDDWVKF